MTSAYRDLERHFRRLGLLGEAAGMLQWDMAAVMPSGGAAIRGEQLAELRLVTHEMLTDARISDLLDRAEQDEVARLDDWERANGLNPADDGRAACQVNQALKVIVRN